MPKAIQPITFLQLQAALGDDYPLITAETKTDDWGEVNGTVVALDYGIPDTDVIRETQDRYLRLAGK